MQDMYIASLATVVETLFICLKNHHIECFSQHYLQGFDKKKKDFSIKLCLGEFRNFITDIHICYLPAGRSVW